MSDITNTQEIFQAYLLDNQDQRVLKQVTQPNRGTIEQRLSIYAKAYWLRLYRHHCDFYPTLRAVMGEKPFELLIEAYVNAEPSTFPSIAQTAYGLSDYLRQKEQVYLADLAKFECMLQRIIDEGEGGRLEPSQLQSIEPHRWPFLQFHLHPTVHCFTSAWDVTVPWYAHNIEGKAPQEPLLKETHILLWRQGIEPYYLVISPAECWMLQAFREGKTFQEVGDGLADFMPANDIAPFLIQHLQGWLQMGTFADFSLKPAALNN